MLVWKTKSSLGWLSIPKNLTLSKSPTIGGSWAVTSPAQWGRWLTGFLFHALTILPIQQFIYLISRLYNDVYQTEKQKH